MKLYVHEILQKTSEIKSEKEKIAFLQKHDNGALRDILRGSFDDSIKWNLPGGKPPYTENKIGSIPSDLRRENLKFAYLAKGGKGDSLIPLKRETIFIGILESIHPEDAKVVVNMINKKQPAKGITKNLVKKAFPNLIQK